MLITTVDSIKLYLYPRDHNPPHIHAIYAEYEALIDLRTLAVLVGDLPSKQLKRVRIWLEGKQEMLIEEFVRLQKIR
ncbi:MAG: DUF4160 domain-containing protein [Proteobacteria bacterium]|nr:MAG: DUF4160 domain-containing protein [Pseudomonadota bacterium]